MPNPPRVLRGSVQPHFFGHRCATNPKKRYAFFALIQKTVELMTRAEHYSLAAAVCSTRDDSN
jgi:hypothetical protein